MTTRGRLSGLACVLLASILSLPAAAADKESGVYFNAGVGVNWADDVDVEIAGISGNVDLDVGARLGLGVGYNFNKYMGVEFDTGFLWNDFDDFDGSLWHLPFMVNGVFRYPNESKFEPYVGGGIGGSLDILYVDDFGIDDTDTDFNFAWQFLAGVRYMLQDNMSLGLGYKFLGVSSSDYDIDGIDIDVDDSDNHSLNVVFNVVF